MPSHQPVSLPDRDTLRLAIQRCELGTRVLLVVPGEIDSDSAPQLHGALQDCLRDGSPDIDVEMSRVTFCDSSGLHVFLDISRSAAKAGGHLRLHRPSPIAARLLTLTGTGTLLFGLPTRPSPAPVIADTATGQTVHFTNGCGKPTANRVPAGRPGPAAAPEPPNSHA
ncbi:STAS domain-containing protein [Streptomycetaceae bacterium NBC_01309]